jgi:anti-sigma regulatory factor (Ser/Thr protein kinase)
MEFSHATSGALSRHLQISSSAPRRAREAVDSVNELDRNADLRFAAQLLTSELVGNAVRHSSTAGDHVLLSLEWDEETIRVEVTDDGAGFDPLELLAHRRSDQRHHGVFLLNALADRWGYRRDRSCCSVWFELDLVPGRRPWRGRAPAREPEATPGSMQR